MSTFLIIIHVIVSIALIMIVLLQTGKGADMGAAFGGGSSQTLFGSTGASTFLGKATTVVAVIFMLTSLALAYRSGVRTGDSIMMDKKAPIEQQAVPAMPTAPDQSAQPAAETAPPLQPAQAGKGAQK
jgi:preprotein translocase subunit SecG